LEQRKQRERLERRSWTSQAARSCFGVIRGEDMSGIYIDHNRRAGPPVHDAGEFGIQIARLKCSAEK